MYVNFSNFSDILQCHGSFNLTLDMLPSSLAENVTLILAWIFLWTFENRVKRAQAVHMNTVSVIISIPDMGGWEGGKLIGIDLMDLPIT